MKHDTIVTLLDRIGLEERGWVLVDHWEADSFAIGIADRHDTRRLVYVSTFGGNGDRYFYECEEPAGDEETDYRVTARADDVSFAELMAAMEQHLRRD